MRKIDYQTLAALIRAEVANRGTESPEGKALRAVAEKFAKRASVDPAAFLRACGIE